ncbi:uncharacterized protein KY384_007130 [Bacidia gigantensis]|uniref:uncharacterized protein n=1 Tax=Bacidia gigantensis TaxID=2732470 RepID=UPI001D052C8D|nr:uncharacterized protein KY384_007130 [Bacidia gigantensis]KAG8528213.1 hypothetical protein KY384_007130 [Bacidia gigantensis]
MPQLLLLLKSKCAFCHKLKLSSSETNRYTCKLRLLEYGLIDDVEELENITTKRHKKTTLGLDEKASEDGSAESEDEGVTELKRRRNNFVKKAIKKNGGRLYLKTLDSTKIEAVSEGRRTIIKQFLSASPKITTCSNCKGISPGWRKDKVNKIFRKVLSDRHRTRNIQHGHKAVNPLVRAAKDRSSREEQRREERDLDEAIGLDLEDLISEEEGEDIEMNLAGDELASTKVVRNPSINVTHKSKTSIKQAQEYITPQEVQITLEDLFYQEKEILELVYNHRAKHPISVDMFFIRTLLVPPNKYRPEARTGEGELAEARENTLYKNILGQCDRIHEINGVLNGSQQASNQREWTFRDFQNACVSLQDCVNVVIDSDKGPRTFKAQQGRDGIKQKLEKKEGLFRMNMMGKRVNFAARSVISPDPEIEVNEIGVPPVFAKKLTFPEPVTNHNFYELKEAVLNGSDKWPGASAIENENGSVINLKSKTFEERQALANQLLAPSSTGVNGARNKKVHRHLTNGDIVLMNRQPTLHKPSIMAHRTRILPGEKTIRMHYANCNTYNADFDGDEMNMHFPQNEIARAEALQIADTDHQYLVATSGKPLRGLIQDHISMGVWLSNRDTFFDREDYHQLLCSCLKPEKDQINSEKIQTVDPAVVKPNVLWTGKQVVTTVLKNIRPSTHPGLIMQGESQTTGERWGDSSESRVVIDDGELLCGVLDKAHLGPSGGGFIHAVYEAYGHAIAGRLLSILGRLLTKFLHMRAFTCGMDDLQLTPLGNARRREKLQEAESAGFEVATKYVLLDESSQLDENELHKRLQDVFRDDDKHIGMDNVYNTRTSTLSSQITASCLPSGLVKQFPRNQMQTMTTSGAKGSAVNANFISCNLGQQNLEGRRVPVMVSGKTLPSFKAFETNIRAGGYITNRFLTGIRPQEYYFHAMAGREGLVDTAVKTARSGYLQRCLIKGMEGLKSEYDATVRDSDGSIVQFIYGEDGLDVSKQKYLTDFRFNAENFLSLAANVNLADEYDKLMEAGASDHRKRAMKIFRKSRRLDCIDPTLALYNPGSALGSTSENFAAAVNAYADANPDYRLKDKRDDRTKDAQMTKRTFKSLMDVKYLKSTIDPGEPVGVVAGQSIGEPSTQMTLNTFHLAGHAAKNVTQGIPRLREILMTASRTISTPTMTLHLIPELSKEAGEMFAKAISKLTIAEVMDSVEVHESIGKGIAHSTAKLYKVKLNLHPAAEYCDTYAITEHDVLDALETKFVTLLERMIKKELTRKGDAKLLKEGDGQPEIGKSSGKETEARGIADADMDVDKDEDDDDGDNDGTNAKQRANKKEAISYDAPDSDEEGIAKQARRESTPGSDDDIDSALGGSPKPLQSRASSEADHSSDEDEIRIAQKEGLKRREGRIKDRSGAVTRFKFDPKGAAWCEIQYEYDINTAKLLPLPLVEEACHKAIIQHIPNIGACTYTTEKVKNEETNKLEEEPIVLTQGVNLRAMHEYQGILDPHRILTNDIWEMIEVYGIEAGRATLIREMDAVFKGHSIKVDLRHLNLIADFMTRGGGFKPFNRTGLASSVSPLQKASFETTTQFVRDAVLEGDWDELKNPSARIVMGKLSKVGTGSFDVFMPLTQQ